MKKWNVKKTMDIFDDEECYEMDLLSITRTQLSNERTFLAYLRTFLGFIATGAAMIQFINNLQFVFVGYVLLTCSFVILLLGVIRFLAIKKTIQKKVFLPKGIKKEKGTE